MVKEAWLCITAIVAKTAWVDVLLSASCWDGGNISTVQFYVVQTAITFIILPLLGCICFLLFNIKRRFPVTSVYYFSLWCQQTNQPKCLYCVRSGKKLDWYIPIQKACLHSYYQNHRYLVIVLFLILCGIWHFSVCLFRRKDQFFCRLTVKWRAFPANTCCNTRWVLRHHQKTGGGDR